MKKFYLGALGCLLAMGASAQKFDQVGTMQGEFWNLQSIPVEYAYDGKSSVYTINEAESSVEYTVYNKSFAVDRTIKVDNPTSYYRTVVESREEVIKPIEMGVIDCGEKDKGNLINSYSWNFPYWWANTKCTNTTYTDRYVYEWFEWLKLDYSGTYEGISIIEKIEYNGGTLFLTNGTYYGNNIAFYFKDNQLIEVFYTEEKSIEERGNWSEHYHRFYNMQAAEFTQDNIAEYINVGQNLDFEDLRYSFDSYQVDSIAVKDDGSTYFYTNAYYQSYFYGKQYPMLYFVWKGESLEAHGLKYKQTYTGEWKQELKEDSYYEENEWLWDVQMFPFCVGEIIGEVDDWGINATQTLFNNDEKWEFLRPIYTEVISNTRESDRDDDGEIDYKEITYRDRLKAYEIVSEDGNVLSSFLVPEGDYYDPRLILWDGETYFGICVEKKIEEDDYTEDYLYEEYMVIYSIDKNASSVKKIASTPAMRVSPVLAERNSTVNVTLDAETVKNGGELIITDSNGRTVGRSHVEAGQTSVPVTTDRMGSGVYNITLTEKGQKVENARIIVK
ncbi:MAG: hypothetical protein IJA98_01505 [Bacteroidaceae bacterium]|nr:hypothetical protein [Bacteroidaceae bacterium]